MNTISFNNGASTIEKTISDRLADSENVWKLVYEGGNDDNATSWTRVINTILGKVAKSINPDYKIACKLRDIRDCEEWLYDFVCYENNKIGLKDIILIAESEWKNLKQKNDDYFDAIQRDFEKLLLAKSPIRIMIFEGTTELEIVNIIDCLNDIIANCKLTQLNDRYMYAAWNKERQDFYSDLYIHS